MRNSSIHFLLFLSLLSVLAGCGRETAEIERHDVKGTVFLVNSNTPVPNALVRFFKNNESDNVWTPESLEEVGSVITDESGRFTIPKNTTAEFVRAYGQISVFHTEEESGDAYLDGYLQGQGDIALYLTPPAWVKVKAVDIEPWNPEILGVQGDTAVGLNPGGEISLSANFVKWSVVGNLPATIRYKMVYEDLIFGPPLDWNTAVLEAFDTTEVIINY